jgi:hypothetical protein
VSQTVPKTARWLGYSGLLPFIAGSAGCFLPEGPLQQFSQFGLLGYSAVILSFMGAVHWGAAMLRPLAAEQLYLASVLPALVAWVSLLLPVQAALAVQATGFTALFIFDRHSSAKGTLPEWYPQLRVPLTAVVLLCLGLAALASG